MPQHGTARRRKWMLIAGYALLQSAVYFVGWPLLVAGEKIFDASTEFWKQPGYLYQAGVWIPAVLVLQCAFVLPVRKPAESRGGKWLSLSIAALAVGLLAGFATWLVGVGIAMLGVKSLEFDIEHLWHWPFWAGGVAGLAAGAWMLRRFRDGVPVLLSVIIAAWVAGIVLVALVMGAFGLLTLLMGDLSRDAVGIWAIGGLLTLLVGWGVSTPLLLAFVRRTHPEYALSRIASVLFLGTLIEAAAIIPLDVMVRRKTNCYCAEGTFFALTALWSVGLLVLGPAVLLLPLGRRRKRLIDGCCEFCGYDLRGVKASDRCPECGAGWKAADASAGSRETHKP